MNRGGFANIVLILIIVILAGAAGYFTLVKNTDEQPSSTQTSSASEKPTLTFMNGAKPFVQINFDYSTAKTFNIYRSTNPTRGWQKIISNFPENAHTAVDYDYPEDVNILFYRITSIDKQNKESDPSPAAYVEITQSQTTVPAKQPPPNISTTPTPTPTPPPTAIKPAPAPKPALAPTPSPIPISQSGGTNYKFANDIFVIEDDGTLLQSGNIVDVEAVSRKFYSLYPSKDNYDFLNIFTTFVDPSKPHLHYPVKSDVRGIGRDDTSNLSSAFGSYKLLGVNFFNTAFTSDQLNSSEQAIKTNLQVIDHELSHQWLMYIGKDFGFEATDNAHYGRWANTGFARDGKQWVDVNGGWPWKDNGDGTLTISSFDAKRGFSNLSLYIMGLIQLTEVPDLEVVVPKNPNDNTSTTITGTFKKISISDIIAKYGQRIPSYQNSQKNFMMAYILLTKKGEVPAQYRIDALNFVAKNFPIEWNFLTYGKSTVNAQ